MARPGSTLFLFASLVILTTGSPVEAQVQAATQGLLRADRSITQSCEDQIIKIGVKPNTIYYSNAVYECKQNAYKQMKTSFSVELAVYVVLICAYVFILGIAIPEFAYQAGLSRFWQIVGYWPIFNLVPLYLAAQRVSAANAVSRRTMK